ncbi:hypothetical protein [Terrabacter sp. BE26]|uniref:hypothetical protein n=1 Tax=Terrabacter sp. BE26 TaxID=2898152 RepID=UPI0035BE7C6D
MSRVVTGSDRFAALAVAECQQLAEAARGARTAIDALTAVREGAQNELIDLL